MRLGRVAGVSDPGRKRRQNEDVYVCKPPLFAVADGMGGARAGEVASALAATAVREDDSPELEPHERVARLIQEANRRVYQRSSEDVSLSGMGTTMIVALVHDATVTFGHVGDSRAYLIRDGRLQQVTDDHSLVAELIRDGKLSPEEAETHPQRSVITRSVGTDPDVDVDTFPVKVEEGDLFLLATDGLTDMISDQAILSIVQDHRHDLDAAARALVRAANRSGGDDNITVVFFEIAGESADAAPTVQLPAEGATTLVDDEDTLSELDSVPALGPPGRATRRPRKAKGRARASKRPGRAKRLLYALGALAALAGLSVATLWGLSRAHFIGAEKSGHVAVYQGVPYDIGGPIRLYRAVYVSPLLAAQLTAGERRRLFDHDLRSDRAAREIVKTYERDLVR